MNNLLSGLRYKHRMMDILMSGPSCIYENNMSVLNYTYEPESFLGKKSNSVCYHTVHESVAMG